MLQGQYIFWLCFSPKQDFIPALWGRQTPRVYFSLPSGHIKDCPGVGVAVQAVAVLWAHCYLSLCHGVSVDDGDNARHQGTPAQVAVSQDFLLGGSRRQRPRQLRHHLPHHGQPSLYCLQKKKGNKNSFKWCLGLCCGFSSDSCRKWSFLGVVFQLQKAATKQLGKIWSPSKWRNSPFSWKSIMPKHYWKKKYFNIQIIYYVCILNIPVLGFF